MQPICSNPVLVTGGTGFLAGHIIHQLLHKGYKVRVSVRNLSDVASYAYLSRLADTTPRQLEVVECNLLETDQGQWDKLLVDEVQYVFHVASPYSYNVIPNGADPDDQLYNPAVNGTLSLLGACARSVHVRKFIFTSCTCALADSFDNEETYTEANWNTTSNRDLNPYFHSKVAAEQEAWRFMTTPQDAENPTSVPHFHFISLLPGFMLGPHLGGGLSTSHSVILGYIEGQHKGVVNISLNITDVRDVAMNEIIAMESANSEGRYCICNQAVPFVMILQVIHENFLDIVVPTKKIPDFVVRLVLAKHRGPRHGREQFILSQLGKVPSISCTKSKNLGMCLRPPIQSIVDTVRYLVDKNLVNRAPRKSSDSCSIM